MSVLLVWTTQEDTTLFLVEGDPVSTVLACQDRYVNTSKENDELLKVSEWIYGPEGETTDYSDLPAGMKKIEPGEINNQITHVVVSGMAL